MSENTLNNLFDQARNEATETNVLDIQKWIGYVTLGALLVGLFTKLKLVFTSKLGIMFYSIVAAAGLGIGAFVMFGTGNDSSSENTQLALQESDSINSKSFQSIDLVDSNGNALPKEQIEKISRLQEIQVPPSSDAFILPFPIVSSPTIPELPVQKIVENHRNSPSHTQNNNKDYGYFDAIRTSGAIEVIIIQGDKSDVSIDADELGWKIVDIKNKNGTLEIGTDTKGKSASNYKLIVTVTVTDLKSIHCSGATDVSTKGALTFESLKVRTDGASDVEMTLNVENLKLDISGATDIELIVKSNNLEIESSGASDIEIAGSAEKLDLNNSGATDFKGYDLKVKEAKLDCSGASSTKVYVSEKLDVEASGASDVKCKGKPSITNKSVTTAASFRQL